MIEEAAGTRMYEIKRQAAQKHIEKKDAKFKELHAVSRLSNRHLCFTSYLNFFCRYLQKKSVRSYRN